MDDMKNVHTGRGNINVTTSGGGGGEIIGIAAVIGAGWLLVSAISALIALLIHLLIILLIGIGVVGALGIFGLIYFRSLIIPKVTAAIGERYGPPVISQPQDYPEAIENTNVVLTAEQYERLRRGYRYED
jgi:hypothetical protein